MSSLCDRRWLRLTAPALLLVLATVVAPSSAQPAGTRTPRAPRVPRILAGTFRYPHDDAHARAIVQRAIEPRLVNVPGMLRDMVRNRIAERMRIARTIIVRLEGTDASVEYRGQRTLTIESAVPGNTTVRNEEGVDVRVAQQLSAGWLEQVFRGDQGELRLLLSTEPDGAIMHVDTTISGGQLSSPLSWRHDYERAPAEPTAE
jgi:hypothetical protein